MVIPVSLVAKLCFIAIQRTVYWKIKHTLVVRNAAHCGTLEYTFELRRHHTLSKITELLTLSLKKSQGQVSIASYFTPAVVYNWPC